MSEAVRDDDMLEERPDRVDHQVIWNKLNTVHREVVAVKNTVGTPGTVDGGVAATGMFAHLNAHHTRIKRFERMWERGLGFAMALPPCLLIMWFLAGGRITNLFGG